MKIRKVLIFNFLVLIFFNFAHPVSPEMYLVKGSPEFIYGFSMGAMSLGALIGSPFIGRIIDLKGTKKIMPLALLGYAICMFFFAVSYATVVMLFVRMISGLCSVMWLLAAATYINLSSEGSRTAKNFGLLAVTSAAGGIVGQLSSGFIGHTNYMYSFYVQIFGLIILSVSSYLILENIKPEKIRKNQKISFFNMFKLLYQNNLLFFILSITAISMSVSLLNSTMGQYLATDYNFGSQQISWISAFNGIVIALSSLLLVGKISEIFHKRKKFIVTYVFALSGFFIFIFFSGWFLIIALILFFIASGIYNPMAQRYITKKNIADSGVSLGILTSFIYIGRVFGSFFAGILFSINHIYPFYFIGIVLIIGFIILISEKNA